MSGPIPERTELYFAPLSGMLGDKPHLISAERIGSILVPTLMVCCHEFGRYPRGLKAVRKLVQVRSTGLKCSACGSAILTHRALVLPQACFVCHCQLAALDDRLGPIKSAVEWDELRRFYAKAEELADCFPPFTWN